MRLTTLGDTLKWAERSFKAAKCVYGHGTNNAWDEAVAIALYVLSLPPDVDASVQNQELSVEELIKFQALVKRRIQEHLPVPYLTHEAWFAGLKFYVDERVIIPRSPFAELIQNGLQPWLGAIKPKRILDLCTGSGCIAIALANHFMDATVDAVDISPTALEVAKINVERYQYQNRVNLLQSDLFSACEGQQYDVIISNPPYVDKIDMDLLPKEYLWEPKLALAAGILGLDVVRRILKEYPKYLKKNGLLFVEVGNSAAALKKEYKNTPFTWLKFKRGGEGVFLLKAMDT